MSSAAAVVVVVAGALVLLPRQGGVGGAPDPSPTPAPTLSPAPAGTTRPTPGASGGSHYLTRRDVGRSLLPDTYTVGVPMNKPLILTLPGGFTLTSLNEGEVSVQSSSGFLGVYLVDKLYSDPCTSNSTVDTPTADAIVSAFHAMAGFEPGPVSRVDLQGRAAKTFGLTTSIDTSSAGCAGGAMLPLFHVAGTTDQPARSGGTQQFMWAVEGRRPPGLPGATQWTGPILIVADSWPTDADFERLRGIVESIRLD